MDWKNRLNFKEILGLRDHSKFNERLTTVKELKNNFLPSGNVNVGITSGASTPDKVVADVIEKLIDISS